MNVGIDLGTTNSALAYIDPRDADAHEGPPIRVLPIPQHVTADAVERVRVLPSFLYLGDRESIGVHAREQGALVPTRLVHSVKSWLSNPEVDRTAKILPWDSEETGRVLSPVEVSAKLLAHLREAWETQRGAPLAEQDVVLCVPASFDEEARELTVQAAADAGLAKLTLLEEPAAAFYAWIADHLAESRTSLFDGQVVLVVDVGGGTSDFTLIRVAGEGDRVEFTRTAVGKHVLLGGDNLDLTLAWLVEGKLGTSLSLRQRNAVRRQCSAAKERLLSNPDLERVELTIVGAGTALVGGVRKADLLRKEVLELALDGFLPLCGLDERPKEDKRSLFRELGLPYVSDPAITRHLAAFMSRAAEQAPHGVDAILFNGGFFVPEVLRQRVADVVSRWYGRRPAVLENRELDLAVAVGAAYYSFARTTGRGVVVRGGLPRAYYIGIGSPDAERVRAVCLVPRGTEDGTTLELDRANLHLLANRPVSFRLYSSLTRTHDPLGAVIEVPREELDNDLHVHAPLNAVMRFGKRTAERLIPVTLGVRLTEVGTLEIWCASKITEHRWRLRFELRKPAAATEPPSRPAAVIADEAIETAKALIRGVFGREPTPAPEELPGKLEQALALGKSSWPLGAIRRLGDVLLELGEGRRLTPAHELRWLNLTGFCLRPGFGDPGDAFRIEQLRRVYLSGLAYPKQVENEVQWWVLWGRVAGGLNPHQQVDVFRRLSSTLLPPGGKRVRAHPALLREMSRAAAGLELLPRDTRIALGDAIARRVTSGRFTESDLWCLMRLGARRLFYGPANQVVAPATAARWIEALLPVEKAADALVTIARRTGDAALDLPAAALEQVRRVIVRRPDADRLVAVLEGDEELDAGARDRMFGEQLPSGLVAG
ncbi:MAG: Hsp70 family protein [Candidatus Rokubacteria bacterium]|nr:Hsp70 family protein [Candidatus Rokubacteria bacterium]